MPASLRYELFLSRFSHPPDWRARSCRSLRTRNSGPSNHVNRQVTAGVSRTTSRLESAPALIRSSATDETATARRNFMNVNPCQLRWHMGYQRAIWVEVLGDCSIGARRQSKDREKRPLSRVLNF